MGRLRTKPVSAFASRIDALGLSSADLASLLPVTKGTINSVKYGNIEPSTQLLWMIDRIEEKIFIYNGTKTNFDNWINDIAPGTQPEEALSLFRAYVNGAINVMRLFYTPEEIQDIETHAKLCELKILEQPIC